MKGDEGSGGVIAAVLTMYCEKDEMADSYETQCFVHDGLLIRLVSF